MRIILLIILVTMLLAQSAVAGSPVPATGTAALVNGVVITTADVRFELERSLRLQKKTVEELTPSALARQRKEALSRLVGRELLYQESRRRGIIIAPAAVEAELIRLRRQYPAKQEYSTSLAIVGLSETAIRSQIERGLAIQRCLEAEISSGATVTERDVLREKTLFLQRLSAAARVEVYQPTE